MTHEFLSGTRMVMFSLLEFRAFLFFKPYLKPSRARFDELWRSVDSPCLGYLQF